MFNKKKETKDYFNNNTEFWSSLFKDSIYGTTTQRVRIVTDKLRNQIDQSNSDKLEQNFKHLDFGCGTGELASISANMGSDVVAIDIAPAMVDATLSSIKQEFINNTKIFQGDVSDLDKIEDSSVDAFSALGLIEYLTVDELETFLQHVQRILSKNGKAYIGSRNRLFNIYTKNEFTDIEKTIGEYDKLFEEYLAISNWITENSLIQSLNDKTKIEPFLNWKYPDSLPKTSAVSVSQRIQYSLCDMSSRLMNRGLKLIDINAVRFHPTKPSLLQKTSDVDLIDKINMIIDEHSSTKWAIPHSSSYILEISKE